MVRVMDRQKVEPRGLSERAKQVPEKMQGKRRKMR